MFILNNSTVHLRAVSLYETSQRIYEHTRRRRIKYHTHAGSSTGIGSISAVAGPRRNDGSSVGYLFRQMAYIWIEADAVDHLER